MTLISKRSCHGLLIAVFCVTMAPGFEASAQEEEAVQKVVELNKKALGAFANLDMEDASKLLQEALDLCAAQKLDNHPVAARTHVHLGVVYVSGLKKRDQGMEEFKKALRIDPNIKVTKSMANPEVQAAFQEAAMDMADGITPAAPAGSAPAPSEPAVPGEKILVHTPVTEGIAGMPIPLKAQVPATLGAARVVVLFRAEGAKEYSTLEMDPVENSDLYQCQIPAEATSGSMVTYTLVVYGDRGQVLAQAGSLSEPYVIALGEGGPLDESGGISEAVPEAGGDSEEEGGTGLWLSLGVGGGFGYHSGQPEANRTDDSGQKLTSSGVAMSQLLHITPELGFFATDSLLLSLQGRLQMVSGASTVKGSLVQKNPDACGGGTCHPASFAVAVLAKATWFLGDPRTVMPFFSLAAGGGQIRQVVGVGKLSGCPSGGCKDTVVGGPVLLGVGGGVSIELSGSFSAVVGANAVMGLPKIMANLDLNLSLAYLY